MKASNTLRAWLLPSLIFGAVLISGCAGVRDQINQMLTLTKCQFRLASVADTSLAGIPLQGQSKIGAKNMFKLGGYYASGTLPLQFTLNVEVKNPNSSVAGMTKLQWILYMDGNQLTQGVLENNLSIPPNDGIGYLPMVMTLDLKKVLSGKSLDSMVNLAKDIAGEGTQPTRVTLQVKPSINVGSTTVDYPGYVTVTHEFPAGK